MILSVAKTKIKEGRCLVLVSLVSAQSIFLKIKDFLDILKMVSL